MRSIACSRGPGGSGGTTRRLPLPLFQAAKLRLAPNRQGQARAGVAVGGGRQARWAHWPSAMLLGWLSAGAAWAQPAGSVVFGSAYTDLSRACRPVGTRREQHEAAAMGQDTSLVCPGPGGQMVYVSFSAWTATLLVGPRGALDGRQRELARQAVDFTDTPGRRVEWRLANGRPFAAILRVVDYQPPADSAQNPHDARYARGTSLVAVGLPGFARIDRRLSTAQPGANAELRRQVDALYAPTR